MNCQPEGARPLSSSIVELAASLLVEDVVGTKTFDLVRCSSPCSLCWTLSTLTISLCLLYISPTVIDAVVMQAPLTHSARARKHKEYFVFDLRQLHRPLIRNESTIAFQNPCTPWIHSGSIDVLKVSADF